MFPSIPFHDEQVPAIIEVWCFLIILLMVQLSLYIMYHGTKYGQ